MPVSDLCPTCVMSVVNLNIYTKVFRKAWTVSNSTPSVQFSGVVVVGVVVVVGLWYQRDNSDIFLRG